MTYRGEFTEEVRRKLKQAVIIAAQPRPLKKMYNHREGSLFQLETEGREKRRESKSQNRGGICSTGGWSKFMTGEISFHLFILWVLSERPLMFLAPRLTNHWEGATLRGLSDSLLLYSFHFHHLQGPSCWEVHIVSPLMPIHQSTAHLSPPLRTPCSFILN